MLIDIFGQNYFWNVLQYHIHHCHTVYICTIFVITIFPGNKVFTHQQWRQCQLKKPESGCVIYDDPDNFPESLAFAKPSKWLNTWVEVGLQNWPGPEPGSNFSPRTEQTYWKVPYGRYDGYCVFTNKYRFQITDSFLTKTRLCGASREFHHLVYITNVTIFFIVQ